MLIFLTHNFIRIKKNHFSLVASKEAFNAKETLIKQNNKIKIGFIFELPKGIKFIKIFIPITIKQIFDINNNSLYFFFIILNIGKTYHRITTEPQVKPLPKAAKTTKSFSFILPISQASVKAIITEAAVVFPYF